MFPLSATRESRAVDMTYSKTHDVEATVEQIRRLHFVGCDIVRLAVPDYEECSCA